MMIQLSEDVQNFSKKVLEISQWKQQMMQQSEHYQAELKAWNNTIDAERMHFISTHEQEVKLFVEAVQYYGRMSPYKQPIESRLFDIIRNGLNHQVCSTTIELLNPKTDLVRSFTNQYGNGGSAAVTVGTFGWALKRRRVSQPIKNFQEFRYLAANRDLIVKRLREWKKIKEADVFDELVNALPGIEYFSGGNSLIEVKIVSASEGPLKLMIGDYSSPKFLDVDALVFDAWGLQGVGIMNGQQLRVSCDLRKGVYGYYNYLLIRDKLPAVIESLAGARKVAEQFDGEKVYRACQEVLGRWLILKGI